jgi:hypothetical protein
MQRSGSDRSNVRINLIHEIEKSGITNEEAFGIIHGASWQPYGFSASLTIKDYDTIKRLVLLVRQRTEVKCRQELEARIRLELSEKVIAALSGPLTSNGSEP